MYVGALGIIPRRFLFQNPMDLAPSARPYSSDSHLFCPVFETLISIFFFPVFSRRFFGFVDSVLPILYKFNRGAVGVVRYYFSHGLHLKLLSLLFERMHLAKGDSLDWYHPGTMDNYFTPGVCGETVFKGL